jgi:hypothetical protein
VKSLIDAWLMFGWSAIDKPPIFHNMKNNFYIVKSNKLRGSTNLFHLEKLLSTSQNDSHKHMI